MVNNIKKVSIDNFRLFEKSSINQIEFRRFNIIYGLNGSGKTTFSTFLDYISKNDNNDDFKKSSFKIDIDNNVAFGKNKGVILNNNDNKLLNKIRVFNRDFIKNNIRWDENLNQILISDTSINFTDELNKNKKEKKDNEEKIKVNEEKIKINDKILSEKAKKIKETYHTKLNLINYNITNLKNDLQIIDNKVSIEEFNNANEILDNKNNFLKLEKLDINKILISDNKIAKINSILKNTNIITEHIEELEDEKNEGAQNFAKIGLDLYKNLKNDKCFFCGSIINKDRISTLNNFFNKAFEKFIESIDCEKEYIFSIINNIDSIQKKINSYNYFPDKNLLNNLNNYKNNFQDIFINYIKYLENIISLLNQKSKSLNFETNIDEYKDIDILKKNLEEFNLNIIEENNNFIEKIINEEDKAKKILKNYLIYDFKKFNTENLELEKEIKEIQLKQQEIENKINDINIQLANSNIACKEINNYLKYIVPNLFIKEETIIDSTTGKNNKIFKLTRNNDDSLATNLSEGEKTIIAFCYFIISLNDTKHNKNEDIIVIDDPISSLDSNFLYNITVILSEKFLNTKIDNQIFLLTHNFYFFKKIIAITKAARIIDKTKFLEFTKIMNKINLKQLDKNKDFILKYSSEYQALIEKIVEYDIKSEPIFIANYIRRVLEVFLSFMVPNEDTIYKKYEYIIKNNKNLNTYRYLEIILNEHSHTDEISSTYYNLEKNPNYYKNLKIEFYEFMYYANKKHAFLIANLSIDINKKIREDIKYYKEQLKCNKQ